MRMKKVAILITITILLMVAGVAYGAEVDYDRASGSVTVSGEGVDYGKTVRMIILKPDVDYEKLISGEVSFVDSCIHIAELKQKGDDGKYTFSKFLIKKDTPAGEYTAVINENGNIKKLIIDHASILQTLGFITDADDVEAVKAYVEKYNDEVYMLPIDENSEYYKLDNEGQNYVLDGLRDTSYSSLAELNIKFSSKVKEYLDVYEVNAFKAISNLKTAVEVMLVMDKYEKVYGTERSNNELFNSLDNTGKMAVYEKMTNEEYSTEEQIQLAFEQKVILYHIQVGPWGKIPEYIEKYNDIMKLDLTKYSASDTQLLKYLVGKNCKNVSDLQNFINNYKVTNTISGIGGGGSSSGGGIKDLGYANSIPTTEQPTAQQTEQKQNTEKESVFSDVPKDYWAYESINALYEKNIVNGRTENIFAPNDKVTRAEAVKIIVGSMSIGNEGIGQLEFTDVPDTAWEYDYVKKAVENGIVKGYDDSTFRSGLYVTREDLCVMIYRAIKNADYEITAGSMNFEDGDKISDYAIEAVSALSNGKIISGMEDGSFYPYHYATRAQVAKVIYNVIK